jgi:hypothetical protein
MARWHAAKRGLGNESVLLGSSRNKIEAILALRKRLDHEDVLHGC